MRLKAGHAAILVTAAAAAAAVLPAVALAGGGGAATPRSAARAAGTHVVVLKDIRFHPATLSIRTGESVTWEWRDGGIRHNVTAAAFHSRTQSSGSFTVRFTHGGTFNYRCTIHAAEGMRGKVTVH